MRILTCLLAFLYMCNPSFALNEFDEISHHMVDDFKVGRPVTPDSINSWCKYGDRAHILSVCEEFPLPDDPEARKASVTEWEGLLSEYLAPDVRDQFHQTMLEVSPEYKEEATLLLVNYMIGLPR